MPIQKVNKLTIFRNAFTKKGRKVNKYIKILQTENPNSTIYQRRFCNNTTALLTDSYTPTAKTNKLLLFKNGNLTGTKDTKISFFYKDFDLKYKILDSEKKIFTYFNYVKKQIKKTSLYSMPGHKLEETATKIKDIDNSVELRVYTADKRKTIFPATKLAGSVHPTLAKKKVLPNGDTIYIEHHDRI